MALSRALQTSLLHDYKDQLRSMNTLAKPLVKKSRYRPLRASFRQLLTLKETYRNHLFTSANLRFRRASLTNNLFKYQTINQSKVTRSQVMNIVTAVLQKVDHRDMRKASLASLEGSKKKCQLIRTVLRDQMAVNAYLWCNRVWAVVTKTIALPSQRLKNNKGYV